MKTNKLFKPVNKPCTYYIYRVFKAVGYVQDQNNGIDHNYVKDFYNHVKLCGMALETVYMTDSLLKEDEVVFNASDGSLYLIRNMIGKVTGIIPRVFPWGNYAGINEVVK